MKKYIIFYFYVLNILGCNTIDVNIKNSIDIPKNFKDAPQSSINNVNNLKNWWMKYNDNNLNNLIQKAFENNLSIKSAQENYNSSNALYNLAKADLMPLLATGSQYNKNEHLTLYNNDLNNISLNYADSLKENILENKGHFYHIDFYAKWEPDIFGKKRSEKDSALYSALSVEQQIYGTELLVTSKLVQDYLYAASIKKRLSVLEKAISILDEQIKYSKGRFNSGQTNRSSINKALANFHKLKSKKQILLSNFKSVESSIATLIGENLQNFSLNVDENILNKKIPVPSGIYPSELLERRPDLRARKNIIMSLMAKVASAKADLFPRFYINFLFNDGHLNLQDLANTTIKRSAFDVGVQLPIFTFGRIKNNILSANAKLQSAIYNYDNSLLQALNETDNLYYNNKTLNISNEELYNSLIYYKKIANDKTNLFKNGFENYDATLNSQLDVLDIEDEYIKNQFYLNLSIIELYQSLGGGW